MVARAGRTLTALVVLGCGGEASGRDAEPPAATDARAALLVSSGQIEEAAATVRDGIAADSGAAALHARLGYVYRYGGLMDESIRAYRRAQALDSAPEAMVSSEGQIAKSLIYLGDYDGAIAAHRKIDGWLAQLEQRPDEKILFYEGVAHLYAGRHADAVRLFDASHATEPASVWTTFGQAYRQAALGDSAQLLAAARSIEQRADVADGERRYRLAHFFALAGEPDAALRHLEASIEAGFFNYPYIQRDPWLESIRPTDEFAALLERARVRHVAFKQSFET